MFKKLENSRVKVFSRMQSVCISKQMSLISPLICTKRPN